MAPGMNPNPTDQTDADRPTAPSGQTEATVSEEILRTIASLESQVRALRAQSAPGAPAATAGPDDRTQALAKGEMKEVAPELSREWFDTTKQCTERAFKFGNETLKAVEDFGLKLSETLVKVPVGAK